MDRTSIPNWVKQSLLTLAAFTLSACTSPAFDLEAWRSAKLAEIQPHQLEVTQPIPEITVQHSLLRGPLDQQVAALAPELTGRIAGVRYSTLPFVNTTSVFLDEPPIIIAQGVCRTLSHEFRAYPQPPASDVASYVFSQQTAHVRFSAAEPDGTCPYNSDQRGFHATSDARAIFLIENARTLAAKLRAKQMRIRCHESLPNCASALNEAFDIKRIIAAGSCEIDLHCIAFQFPHDGPAAPNGISVEIVLGSRWLTVAALSVPIPF